MARVQRKRKSPRNTTLILDWLHIITGILVVAMAVTAFINPEDNMILFPVIFFLAVGVIIGTAIGALPGLSATMGIAIMTPITFNFAPANGFAMLMGLWNAAIFAGGISAILVNTPGTPASITQSFDGYSLYRQGKGGLALGINVIETKTQQEF